MSEVSNIQWKLDMLQQSTALGVFDCSDKDLNDFLTEKDEQEQTRAMYLDLKAFA